MAAALAERERMAAPVPEDLLELYIRIAKRHNGTAMAQVRDDQCRGLRHARASRTSFRSFARKPTKRSTAAKCAA